MKNKISSQSFSEVHFNECFESSKNKLVNPPRLPLSIFCFILFVSCDFSSKNTFLYFSYCRGSFTAKINTENLCMLVKECSLLKFLKCTLSRGVTLYTEKWL